MRPRPLGLIVTLILLGAPPAAEAQQPGKVHRLGVLGNSPTAQARVIEAFRRGLRDLGWIEGQNILTEYRWAEGKSDRFPDLAAELVRLNPDLIFAPSSIYVEAVKPLTATIPIVFAVHADPIGTGHVASLARPGGNITGLAQMQTEVNAKGLELLKEAVPSVSRVAVFWDPATPSHGPVLKAVEDAAQGLRLQLQPKPRLVRISHAKKTERSAGRSAPESRFPQKARDIAEVGWWRHSRPIAHLGTVSGYTACLKKS